MVNNKYSEWSEVTSGVPQGTILGPLLILIFINNISDKLDCICRLYADDCIIYRPIDGAHDVISLTKCAVLRVFRIQRRGIT